MNNICVTGRLTKDSELYTSTSGNSVCSFVLAVGSRLKNAQGEWGTSFINCIAFGKLAESTARIARKGDLIEVEGFINQRKYTTKNGDTRTVLEIIADRTHLLNKKKSEDGIPPFDDAPAPVEDSRNLDSLNLPMDDLPF